MGKMALYLATGSATKVVAVLLQQKVLNWAPLIMWRKNDRRSSKQQDIQQCRYSGSRNVVVDLLKVKWYCKLILAGFMFIQDIILNICKMKTFSWVCRPILQGFFKIKSEMFQFCNSEIVQSKLKFSAFTCY